MPRNKPKSSRKIATSFDVARKAGVSRAVVSRAFNPGSSISADAREKVLRAADELGYRVNPVARALNMQRTDLVGMIASGMNNPYRAAQIDALAKALVREGFRPMLFCIDEGPDTEQLISMLLNYSVSGVIVTSDLPPEAICRECADRHVPLIIIDRGHQYAFVDQVTCDNAAGGRLAADVLIDGGCERLCCLEPDQNVYSISWRLEAFAARAVARNVPLESIPIDAYDYDSGQGAAEAIARSRPANMGVFCPNDLCAIGLLDELRQGHGIKVPETVCVVGYDDIPQASWRGADLTTIGQPAGDLASATVQLLRQRIGEPESPERRVVLPVELVRRGTTR